ncbi:TIGR03809 family protein [Rhodopseudomonas sp. HC1]|uniref:TIGR03809 family protein n=1 Tax=Rhodopseudomonas infernalis TaxID=2897386 RepID=UPI001EE7A357|nr:TIGR03809 family protein [Rhodopseudomonas infernalis]MCG6203238.1 TIGR03809 family protein [Rhodopseudomonas infernalis]
MEVTDAMRGRAIVERWCVLAEQRLEYLTELFETGRWRRFFTEVAFLENIQEAKAAVDTWRDLLYREATDDNLPVDLSWLGQNKDLAPRPIFYLSDETAVEPTRVFNVIPSPVAPAPEQIYSVTLPVELESDDPGMPALEMELAVEVAPPQLSIVPPIDLDDDIAPDIAEPIEIAPPAWQHALDVAVLAERYPLLRRAS